MWGHEPGERWTSSPIVYENEIYVVADGDDVGFTRRAVTDGDIVDVGPMSFAVLHTPGHTPGSISVLIDDVQVIAGDLAASGIFLGGIALKNRPKQPPFEEDPQQVAKSLAALLSLGCTRFYLGHGGPLGADKIRKHVAFLEMALA